jgi:hydroxymethylpyrimidine/phosphomethylpyrimidine kinase
VTAQFVGEQLDAVFLDIGADAVKIGMLHDVDIIRIVKQKLAVYSPRYVVIDPVMVAKSGARLITETAVSVLENELFPDAYLITPNIPEAEILLGCVITDKTQMEQAAKLLAQKYQLNVLLKGGHLVLEKSCDVLYDIRDESFEWFEAERIHTKNTHGTGCTFSSAITAFLAFDHDLKAAISQAKRYLTEAIFRGKDYQLGHGAGPVG